ncbi:hypothetical protein ABPG72_021987 [Tetrahymena utriculariae]
MDQVKQNKIFQDGKYIQFKNSMDKSQIDLYLVNQKYYDILTIDSYLNSQNSESLARSVKYFEKLIAFSIKFNDHALDSYASIEELCRNLQLLEKLKFLQLSIDTQIQILPNSEFLIQLGKSLTSLQDLEYLCLSSYIPDNISDQQLKQLKTQLEQLKKLYCINFKFKFVSKNSHVFLKEFANFFTNIQQLQNLNLQFEFQNKLVNEIDTIIPRIYSLGNLKKIQLSVRDHNNLSIKDIQQLQKDLMSLNSLSNLKLSFKFLNPSLTQQLNELLNTSLTLKTIEKFYFQIVFQSNQDFQFTIGSNLTNPSNLSKFTIKLKNNNEQSKDFQVVFDENIKNLINLKKMTLSVQFIKMYEYTYRNLGKLLTICKKLENLNIESNCDIDEDLFIEFGQTFSNLSSLKQLYLGLLLNKFEHEKYGFMDGISQLVQLEELEVQSLYYFLEENLPKAFQNLANLKAFSLNSYMKVTNKDLESFGDSLLYLKSLKNIKMKLPLNHDTQNISKISSSIGSLVNLSSINICFFDFLYNNFCLDFNWCVQLLKNISNLTNLIELTLEFQTQEEFQLQFDNLLVNTIMNLPKLRKLQVDFQQSGQIKIIRKHKRLVTLYLI